jgi:putative ABC transport system permease protein
MTRGTANSDLCWTFSYRMAWRETRASWRHFVFFFVSISLGVAALIAVSLFAVNFETAIQREGRALMAADAELRARRPLNPEGLAVLESLRSRGIQQVHLSELVAMVAAGKSTQLVELKAVERGYPFYGRLRAEPEGSLSTVFAGPNALAEEGLMIRLALDVGDTIKLGQTVFRISGVLKKEPDRAAGAFSFGPRVLISQAGLAATGLVQPGSRITHRYLLKLPETINPQALRDELADRVPDKSVRVSQYQDAQPMLRRFLRQLTMYLGLAGLIALIIGGIGVATNVRAFLKEKLESIAVLKVLGAEPRTILWVYLLQTLGLGLLGCVAGAILGAALQFAFPPLMRQWLPVELQFRGAFWPFARGMLMGLLTTALFAVWPLMEIRRVRPNLIFRNEVSPEQADRPGLPTWAASGGLGLALLGLTLAQAESWKSAGLFIGALVLALLLLQGTAWALLRIARRLPRARALIWRQAIANLYRPGSQARTVIVSVGVGFMVILAVHLVQRNMLWEIGQNIPRDAPSFFFIDIQPDQQGDFARILAERGYPDVRLTPLVRSRLSAVEGEPVRPEAFEKREHGWYFTREYVLTFQRDLPKDNVLIGGRWWDQGSSPRMPSDQPWVSVEEEAARHLGLKLGSSVEFDIQGAKVTGTVSSLRKVNWRNMSTNFYFIFEPGALDSAPMTYVATARVAAKDEIPLQQAIVAKFPNVSAINIRDILDSVARVLDRISLVIRFMAGLTILAGLIVLAGALAATRFQRIYEAMILKAVGARRGTLASMFLVEYGLLGAAAGVIGAALATGLAWGVMHWILDVPWLFQPQAIGVGVLATVVMTVTVGILSTFRILGLKPLPVLRRE